MYNALFTQKEKTRMRMRFLIDKLDMLSPLNVLSRGYGIVKSKYTNTLVKSVEDIKIDDKVEITLKDGTIDAGVLSIIKGVDEKREKEKQNF